MKPVKRSAVLVQAVAREGVACFHPQFVIDAQEFRATVHVMAASAGKSLEVKAMLNSARELLTVLQDVETAFDGEEYSVREEHAELISRIKSAIKNATLTR